jgi:hypothetical protein
MSHGAAWSAAPMPPTPAAMSTASDTAQIAATTNTCSRRMPWRSTNTFCAPMATMSDRPRPKPATSTVRSMPTTLDRRTHEIQLRILHRH